MLFVGLHICILLCANHFGNRSIGKKFHNDWFFSVDSMFLRRGITMDKSPQERLLWLSHLSNNIEFNVRRFNIEDKRQRFLFL
jgi:hypothetical protein